MDKSEREQLLKNIQYSDADWLESASEIFKKDKEFILEAVKLNGRALEYADDSLKKDKKIVLEAVKENHYAIWEMDESLDKNKEIILMAVKDYSEHLECANDSLRKDKNFILQVVNINGYALRYVGDKFKKDKEVVLKAVKAIKRDITYSKTFKKYVVEFKGETFTKPHVILKIMDKSLKKDPDILAILNKIKK